LGNAHAKAVYFWWLANKRQPWVHLTLHDVCRYFYADLIPLKGGELSAHRETIHENLVNLFFRCCIAHLLEEPQGCVERKITPRGD
jgi:hypothetical protein